MTPEFRPDLYRGTAEYYDRYRPRYPDALFADLRARVPISRQGRLLDLACGPGTVAFPLADAFAEVVAVDQEPDFVAFVRAKADRLDLTHVQTLEGRAEDVVLAPSFELITIGNAFHRLDRPLVAARCVEWLEPGGCVALLWASSQWGDVVRPWQQVMGDVLGKWTTIVGATDRVPHDWQDAITRDPHEDVLTRVGLSYEGQFDFEVELTWTVETLLGLTYSTSFLNRVALGDAADEFEQDFRRALRECEPSGVFVDNAGFRYQLARRN